MLAWLGPLSFYSNGFGQLPAAISVPLHAGHPSGRQRRLVGGPVGRRPRKRAVRRGTGLFECQGGGGARHTAHAGAAGELAVMPLCHCVLVNFVRECCACGLAKRSFGLKRQQSLGFRIHPDMC